MKQISTLHIRQVWVGWFLVFLWVLLLVRLAFLQIALGIAYGTEAESQHRVKVPLLPERGRILDRNGRLLAGSLEVLSLYALPYQVKKKERTAHRLASLGVGIFYENLKRLSTKKRFVWIERDLKRGVIEKVERLDLPGIGISRDERRYYPMGELAGNLLGFVGEDGRGLEGVEFEFDSILKGKKGWAILQRGAQGGVFHYPEYPELPPRRGRDIRLTIDADIQSICESALEEHVKRFQANGGSVLCMNPKTGEILAMATYPSYDPNRGGRGSPESWRNRIITDLFEPGSTFKIVVDAGAIEKRVVDLDEQVDDGSGVITVSGHKIKDPKKHGPYTFREAVERSGNAASVRVADRVGKGNLYHYARGFGFGSRTGIDLPGEAEGILSPPKEWSSLKFANIALGQGLSSSCLQLAMAFSVIANEGVLLKPQIRIDEEGSSKIRGRREKVIRRVISRKTARIMKDLLNGVVERGTGELAKIRGIPCAGKTGTAQKVTEKGGYSLDRLITSFVGFAPVEDPIILVACFIDEPKGGEIWGATVSAPLYRDIVKKVIHLNSYEPIFLAGMN